MTSSLSTVSYIGATILFILCLGGLSNPETSRRGNLYGMIGMATAVLATTFGPQVTATGLPYILAAMLAGAAIVALRLPRPAAVLWLCAAGYLALIAGTFVQAIMAQPFLG